jgi:peptide/nickel transport system permease protein
MARPESSHPRLRRWTRKVAGNRSLLIGLTLLVAIALLATVGRWQFAADPWEMAGPALAWPGEEPGFPLGTDLMGRDLATEIVAGAPVTLLIAFLSTGIAAFVGVAVGSLCGYHGGWVDNALMRLTELFQTFPSFVLAVVLVAVLKPSVVTIILSIGIVSWPATARLVRSQVLSLREREFVLAGRAMGMSDARLIATQILPNALPPAIVVASLTAASAIQTEAALAFLGLGDPNVMTWGTIIGSGRDQLSDAWYVCALPGAAIMATVLAFNLTGDGVNDALNPRLDER